MIYAATGRVFTVKNLIRAALTAMSIASIGAAQADQHYRAPPHNFYQNNWMAGGGG